MSNLDQEIDEYFSNEKESETTNEVDNDSLKEEVEAVKETETDTKTEDVKETETDAEDLDDSSDSITFEEEAEEEVVSIANNDTENANDIIVEEEDIDVSRFTDGEFSSVKDLVNSYKELKENTLNGDDLISYLDEQSEKEYGLSYSELNQWKNMDIDSIDEMDLISDFLILKDPDISDIEIEAELAEFELLNKTKEEIKELIEDGEIEEKDFNLLQAKFNKRVRESKRGLEEFKSSIDTSKIKIPTGVNKDKSAQPTKEDIEAYQSSVRKEISSLNSLKLNLGGKDSQAVISYALSEKDKGDLSDTVLDSQWVVNRWRNESGEVDKKKVYRDALILNHFNKIAKVIYNEGVAKGSKQTVVNEDNIDLKNGRAVPQKESKSMKDISDGLLSDWA